MYELLPKEIILKIYEYDSTYYEKYNKIINTIKRFPKFDFYIKHKNSYECYFIKEYDHIDLLGFQHKFSCKENYKKASVIVAKAFSKSGTFK